MSGSMIIDLLLILLAIGAFFTGLRQGGFAAILSLVGVLIGGYLGLYSVRPVMNLVEKYADSTQGTRFAIALITIALLVVVGYSVGSGLGQRLRDKIRTRTAYRVDSGIGAVASVFTTLIVTWLIAIPVVSNQDNEFARAVRGSAILSAIGQSSPEWVRNIPARVGALINASDIPAVTDPFSRLEQREVQPPDATLKDLPEVAAVAPSVVKVRGLAEQCSRMLQGTGFVVAKNLVMTNAHVVAGTNTVNIATVNGHMDTDVVYYNPQQDIALLRTRSELTLPSLKWADEPAAQGDDAIALGYPLGGSFKASPTRVRDRFVVSGPNIYADQRIERDAYSLRGTIVQGNSGGPLVSTEGEVFGLVFGADMNESDTGYALTRDEVFKHLGDLDQWESPVETQSCVAS